jgi:hypothetical protein
MVKPQQGNAQGRTHVLARIANLTNATAVREN